MTTTHVNNLIERYEKILPKVIYPSSIDEAIEWTNDHQRREWAKIFAAQALEERIRELDMVRGNGTYILSADGSKQTLEQRVIEIRATMEQIKSI